MSPWRASLAILAAQLASVALGVLPARAETEPPTLAFVGVTGGEGTSEKQAKTLEEVLLSSLASGNRLKVTGRSDIQVLVGLEAAKQQVGCEEDASCLAELAGALGVAYVASADAGRIGEVALLTLKVIHVGSGTTIARPRRAFTSDSEFVAAAEQVAREAQQAIADDVAKRTGTAPGPSPLKLGGFVAIGAGVVAGLVAGGLYSTAATDAASLRTTPRAGAEAQALVQSINFRADAVPVLGALGAVLAAGGIALAVVF